MKKSIIGFIGFLAFISAFSVAVLACSQDVLNKDDTEALNSTAAEASVDKSGIYTVNHYQQKTTGGNSLSSYDLYTYENKSIRKGSVLSDVSKKFEGFKAQSMSINEKVINVFYNRYEITYTFKTDGCLLFDDGSKERTFTGLYGNSFSVPVLLSLEYHFDYWKLNKVQAVPPSTFGTEDLTFEAVYHKVDESAEYGDYNVLTESDLSRYGITDSSVPAKKTGATYVEFGVWPQTIKAAGVSVDESESTTQGAHTYYKGSDGLWYAKVRANPNDSGYKFSNGETISRGTTYYFRVEPIIWRVLDSGSNLMLAERILTAGVPYYGTLSTRTLSAATIYANNYKYSNIRAWLNGINNQFVSDGGSSDSYTVDWSGTGFLQTAFTSRQQLKIAVTTVDNSAQSTTDSAGNLTQATQYACDNTEDKIFLLSEKEVTDSAYGFGSYYSSENIRRRKPTDFALANSAYDYGQSSSGYGGWWWLRSPNYYRDYYARAVSIYGHADYYNLVNYHSGGVVPALLVTP